MNKMMDIPLKVGPFQLYKAKETEMVYGTYYDSVFELPFASDKRHIRVWLPEDYVFGGEKRFPVIYMSDGQNLVDRCLSAYGDWHLDRVMHRLKEEGFPNAILVGIDCPKDPGQRENELNPPHKVRFSLFGRGPNKPIGDKMVNFMADELKPLIDELFLTLAGVGDTAIGGSSMGGIMAFYGFMSRPDVFGFSLSFSPPFFFYSRRRLLRLLDEYDVRPESKNKVFLYVGGEGFEKKFTDGVIWMAETLKNRGFGEDKLLSSVDKIKPHHEEAWSIYSYDAFKFWLG